MGNKRYFRLIIWSFFCLGLLSNLIYAQSSDSNSKGLFFDVGGGYNQLFWESNINGDRISFDRTAFSFFPNFRVGYYLNMTNKIHFQPFIGHNVLGGSSGLRDVVVEEQEYVLRKDRYRIRSISAGFMGMYSFSKLRIGIGTKLNYQLHIHQKFYTENHPTLEDGWHASGTFVSPYFKRWSYDYGFRVDYPLSDKIIIGSEAWFGQVDLQKNEFAGNANQNHFRVLFRYSLK